MNYPLWERGTGYKNGDIVKSGGLIWIRVEGSWKEYFPPKITSGGNKLGLKL